MAGAGGGGALLLLRWCGGADTTKDGELVWEGGSVTSVGWSSQCKLVPMSVLTDSILLGLTLVLRRR